MFDVLEQSAQHEDQIVTSWQVGDVGRYREMQGDIGKYEDQIVTSWQVGVYLHCISLISPLHLHCISPASPLQASEMMQEDVLQKMKELVALHKAKLADYFTAQVD